MKVLITGCGGAIGKYLAKEILSDDRVTSVIGIDREPQLKQLMSSNFLNDQQNKFIPLQIDLSSDESINSLPDVDFVYHLAAINGTQLFYDIPWDVFINSIKPTINLINFYKDRKLKRFVYTSSSEVYASLTDLGMNKIPTPEDCSVGFANVLNPRWSYGGAKLSGEIALISASHQFNLDFSIIRYHNVYGKDMGLNHVIPDFIERGKQGIFQLNGSKNIRSFIYIKDAVDATILVANSNKAQGQIINIGTDETLTMRQLSEKIMQIFGWEGKVEEFPAPDGSTMKRCPDIRFLRDQLGFQPKFSLTSGLQELYSE
jgi:UDP-glucose 4-epimerase